MQDYVTFLPRNWFENLDFERGLNCGSRRLINEERLYDKGGKMTELEFLEDFAEFEFLAYFKTGEEKQFEQLIASLNDFDMPSSPVWKWSFKILFFSRRKSWAIIERVKRRIFIFIRGYWIARRLHLVFVMLQIL